MAKAKNIDTAELQEKLPVVHFQEWYCQIKIVEGKPVAEKLKVNREVVMITDDEARVLNEGRLWGDNSHVLMYFKPE